MAGGTAGAGRATSTYFARAILDSRSTLHLSYRLVVRLVQWTTLSGAAAPGTGMWRAALPLFVVLDLVTWQVLRRNDRFGLGWRLALDCADIAFWSLSPLPASRTYDIAVLIGVPLAVESGVRIGIRALVVPAVVLVVVGVVRVVAEEPVQPFTPLWLVLSLGVGVLLFSYCQGLDEQAEAERRRRRAADSRWAHLVGQNAVAMGADSVVDVIEGLVPVLGRPGDGSALWRLADGWKAQLAADTAAQAAYLHSALLSWEAAHNRHPDLSSRVEVHLGEGTGTAILTGRQVAWLHAALDERRLLGRVSVALVGGESEGLPGGSLDLDIDGYRLRVPADRAAAIRPVDTGPVTYGLIAAQMLPLLSERGGAVPAAAVGSGVVVCAAAAWWSHRQLLRKGPGARPAILATAVATSLVITVLTCPFVSMPITADGETVYVSMGAMLLGVIGGMYSHGLQRRLAVFVGLAVAANAALMTVLTPSPVALRSVLGSLVLALAPYPTTRHISRSLARATARHVEATADEDEQARQHAFAEGQQSVLDLVRLARDDARAQLAAIAPRLEPTLRDLVSARLEEVDRRLLSLAPGG